MAIADANQYQFLRQYSCPQVPWLDDWRSSILAAYGRSILDLAMERWTAEIERRANGLSGFLSSLTRSEIGADLVWDPAFGRLTRALQVGDIDPLDAFTHVALRAASFGSSGSWDVELEPSSRMPWGRWLLPPARFLACNSQESSATLSLIDATSTRVINFHKNNGEWFPNAEGSLTRIGSAGNLPVPLLSLDSIPNELRKEILADESLVHQEIDESVVSNFEAAFTILSTYAPVYYSWIVRVLRGVIVGKSLKDDVSRSGSWKDAPGLVFITVPPDRPMAVASALVHECTHQYLHIAELVGAVDNGTDSKLYYSAATKSNRPLSRILVAYHAFANIRLFLSECKVSGYEGMRAWTEANDHMRAIVQKLEEPLSETTGLSGVGRALYEPLRDQIRDLEAAAVNNLS